MSDTTPINRRFSVSRLALGGLVFLLIAGACFYAFRPPAYTATAWFRVLERTPFLFQPADGGDYSVFIETQRELILSPLVLDKALESPEMASLGSVTRQGNKQEWLRKKLDVRRRENSELLTVSITLPEREESARIVNAVVTAYYEYYEAQEASRIEQMIRHLNMELTRQTAVARRLQEDIQKTVPPDAAPDAVKQERVPQIAFKEEQLQRVEGIIDTLQNRMLTLQAEMNAPGRVRLLRKAATPK